tara:strand:- start:1074 stop:4463 length:3390 start_codon:yes stop_codon:yes gene_type:complete
VPKQVHELKQFNSGIVFSASETDIPEEAPVYSLNVDPMAEQGVLQGITYDSYHPVASAYGTSSTADGGENSGGSHVDLADASSFASSGQIAFTTDTGNPQILSYSGKASNKLENVDEWSSIGNLGAGANVYQYSASTVRADRLSMFNDDGTHRIVYFDDSDNKLKKIDDFHHVSTLPTQANLSSSAESHTGLPAMEKNNKEIHIGMGKGSANVPRWTGIISHGQFGGSAPSGIQLDDAELKSPTIIPDFHKVVSDGTHMYGIEWGGNIIYKMAISDYSLTEAKQIVPDSASSTTLPQFSAIALASDNNLWLVSLTNKGYDSSSAPTGTETLGTWYKVNRSTLQIMASGVLQCSVGSNVFNGYGYVGPDSNGGSTDYFVISDMIEIGSYLWFSGAVGITGQPQILYSRTWLLNKTTSTFTDTTTVTLDQRNFNSQDGGGTGAGDFELGTDPAEDVHQARGIIPSVCLIDPKHGSNEYCAVLIELYDDDGNNLTAGGYGIRNLANASDIVKISTGVFSVKYDQTQSTNLSNFAALDGGGGATEGINLAGRALKVAYSGNANVLTVKNASDATLTDIYSWVAYDHDTAYSGGGSGGDAHFRSLTDEGDPNDDYDINKGVPVVLNNSSYFDLHVFAGSGVGRWMSQINVSSVGAFTTRLESNVSLVLSENAVTSGIHTNTKEYFYKFSFLYDGYQESPLSDATKITSTGKEVVIDIQAHNATNVSKRVTDVIIYMAEGASGALAPTGFYRYVATINLDSTWTNVSDNAVAPDWGGYYSNKYLHSQTNGASYEARTGISEVLDKTIVNYGLSTQLNSHLFVARCYHKDITNASNYLFKSRPYNFDQFNWARDFMVLPTYPTAITSFNNRIFVFDENNIYQIEPNNLYVENTITGVGAISQDTICVTDFGICILNTTGAYLFNGKDVKLISTPINRNNSSWSWESIDFTYDPKIVYHQKLQSFLITFKSISGTYNTWAYNIMLSRWDLWRLFYVYQGSQSTAVPYAFFTGNNGHVYANVDGKIFNLMRNTVNKRSFDWHSKHLTLGQHTQFKRFNNFSVTGNPSGTLGTHVYVQIDGNNVTETDNSSASGSVFSNFVTDTKSGKYVQWFLSGQTGTVDALGLVYRRKIVNAEQTS